MSRSRLDIRLNFRISPRIISNLGLFLNLSFKNFTNCSSFSTAITFLAFSSSFSVKIPLPGPTSKTISSETTSPAETISSAIFSDFKKFCPNDFLGLFISYNIFRLKLKLLHFVKMVGNVGQKSGRHIHLLIAVNGPYHAERQKKFFFGSGYRHVKQSSFFFVPFLVPVAESAVRKQSFFQSDNENIFEFQTLGGVNRHQPDTVFFFPLPAGRLVHRVLSAHQNSVGQHFIRPFRRSKLIISGGDGYQLFQIFQPFFVFAISVLQTFF